jgi:hypothetical protein
VSLLEKEKIRLKIQRKVLMPKIHKETVMTILPNLEAKINVSYNEWESGQNAETGETPGKILRLPGISDYKIWNQYESKPFLGAEAPLNERSGRQKRYSLEEKAGFIEYVLNREKSEIRSNLSEYAEYHGVSRETLYVLRRKFIEAFEERSPGPKIKATEQIVRKLEEEFRKERQEYELLQKELGHLQQEQEKQKERLLRTLLQVSVSPMSAREIKALIETGTSPKEAVAQRSEEF